MKAYVFLTVIFILAFSLLFWFFRRENKKEQEKDSVWTILLGTTLFAVLITGVFAFFLFLVIGAATVIDRTFSLHMEMEQLVLIGISYLIYLFTIDNMVEKVFGYVMGKNLFSILSLLLVRMAGFYFIGLLLHLNETMNLTIAGGVAIILIVVDLLFSSRKGA